MISKYAPVTKAPPLLFVKVVDESDLSPLRSLGHNNMSAVSALAIHNLESPDLLSNPALLLILSNVGDEALTLTLDLPALLEELVGDLVQRDPAAAARDGTKQPVGVVAREVVEAAVLLRARQARRGLLDVDVRDDVGGGVGRLGRALVLLDLDGDGGQADALADEVADALQGEHRLRGVGERLVLCVLCVPLVEMLLLPVLMSFYRDNPVGRHGGVKRYTITFPGVHIVTARHDAFRSTASQLPLPS